MAKKDRIMEENEDSLNEEKEKGGNLLSILLTVVVFSLFLVIFIIFIKLDIGGIATSMLEPLLRDVPVINKILPEVEVPSGLSTVSDYESMDEAVTKIRELERTVEALEKEKEEMAKTTESLEEEIERLEKYEEEQKEFKDRVAEFEKEIVYTDNAPDIAEYKSYYESISPENAEKIYKQIVKEVQVDQKIIDQANIYIKMDPESAADALEAMMSDIDLVVQILNQMQPSKSALILQEMDPSNCASITKKMATSEE